MEYFCSKCNSKVVISGDSDQSFASCPKCSSQVAIAELETKMGTSSTTGTVSPEVRDLPFQKLGGDFEILELIGKGGMGAVFKARQNSLHRFVAVKVLPPHFSSDAQFVHRFHREAETMASLNHPNLVSVISKGEEQGIYYFVMEYVDGESLASLLQKGNLAEEKKYKILKEICSGLAYAHDKGLVHRDIKPANILLQKDGTVKISDFGLVRIMGDQGPQVELTETNMAVGTLKYMSPEQKVDSKSVDQRADIYSLGVMIYEMFTGKEAMGRFDLPSEVNKQLDRRLDTLVQKTLHPDPSKRFSHIKEVQKMLQEIEEKAEVLEATGISLNPTTDENTVVSDRKRGFTPHGEQSDQDATALCGPGEKKKKRFSPFLLIPLVMVFLTGLVITMIWISLPSHQKPTDKPSSHTTPPISKPTPLTEGEKRKLFLEQKAQNEKTYQSGTWKNVSGKWMVIEGGKILGPFATRQEAFKNPEKENIFHRFIFRPGMDDPEEEISLSSLDALKSGFLVGASFFQKMGMQNIPDYSRRMVTLEREANTEKGPLHFQKAYPWHKIPIKAGLFQSPSTLHLFLLDQDMSADILLIDQDLPPSKWLFAIPGKAFLQEKKDFLFQRFWIQVEMEDFQLKEMVKGTFFAKE